MRIIVHAKPKSHDAYIEQTGENEYNVAVQEPPIGGKANDAVVRALADYFGVLRAQVKIISGHTARKKVVEISEYSQKK